MGRVARILLFIGVIWTLAAKASTPVTLTDKDWIAVAQTCLAEVDRSKQSIIVMDKNLAPAAQKALKYLRKTIFTDELPDQDRLELPPGGYLRVRQFDSNASRFEFESTSGVIPKNAGLNCGFTEHFFVVQNAKGIWKLDGTITETMC